MGLDISAYSKLRKIADAPRKANGKIDWDAYYDKYESESGLTAILAHPNPDFMSQAEGLEEAIYVSDGEYLGFRAGSYNGYSDFRRKLCIAALEVTAEELWENPEEFKGKPFFELINFSDCEGFIGPVVSAKLYDDFVKYEDEVMKAWPATCKFDRDWYGEMYRTWKEAFGLAKDGGLVEFH